MDMVMDMEAMVTVMATMRITTTPTNISRYSVYHSVGARDCAGQTITSN